MRVNILGAPELLGEERKVPVQAKLWCVLLSLILNPGIPVQSEDLVDRIWGMDPSENARSTLRTYIRRVEVALSQAAGRNMRIARRDGGYALDIPAREIDLHHFRELKDRADATEGSASAVTLFKRAESFWRGGALAGLSGDWISRIRVGLEEELRSVTARRVELELSLGRHSDLLAELSELTERYPLDATFAAQRMIALFRTGRQTDALRVYQRVKSALLAEGLDPDPVLEDYYMRILRHDPDLLREHEQRPVSTLPSRTVDFVGRTREVAALLAPSSGRTCVRVIEGMAGIGKTELAVHAARAAADCYPDGQLYLNLRGSGHNLDPAEALRDLLVMLGAAVFGGTLGERRQQWLDELGTRRLAIVLDDAAGPEQIGPLIPENAGCLVIVTSHRRVDWGTGERLWLGPLPEVDAARLFTSVAGDDVEHKAVAEVARLCDGLPLAIRLVAVQTRMSTVDNVLRGLRENGGVIDGVDAAFALSCHRLSQDERRFFQHLGMSPCTDFSSATAAALADVTERTAARLLSALCEQSLLAEKSSGRFAMHDLVRGYARTLSRADGRETAIRRLADHYVREAERAADVMRSREHVPGLGAALKAGTDHGDGEAECAWFAAEYENILLLAEYCGRQERKRHSIRLVRGVSDFLETNGHWGQARHAHELARRACRDMDDIHGAAEATRALSLTSLRTGRFDDASAYATEAKALFARTGDRHGQAEATDLLGVVCRHEAGFRAALAHHEEAIDISRGTGDSAGAAQAMLHAATALHMLGRLTEEMAYLTEALGVFRRLGDRRGQGIFHNSVGLIHLGRGLHRDAAASFQSAHEIFHEIGGRQSLTLVQRNMGKVHEYRGRRAEALTMFRRALAEYRAMGDLPNEAFVRADIGAVLGESENYPEAIAEYDRALAIAELVGDSYAYVQALCGLADIRRESDALEVALTFYERAERQAAQIEAPYPKARALQGMAEVMLLRHDADTARIYWREALDIYQMLGSHEAGMVAMRLELFARSA
jgi:DNA-binding SARP family transcriptional activator/tetratricopeptide (TPR) repeat protein